MTVKPFKERDKGNVDAMTMHLNAELRKLEEKLARRLKRKR